MSLYIGTTQIPGINIGNSNASWMGKNPTKVATCLSEKKFLSATPYSTWTPTTTSTTLVSAETLSQTYNLSVSRYDYFLYYKWHTHFEYSSTDVYPLIYDCYNCLGTIIYGKYGSLSDITNNSKGLNNSNITSGLGVFYKNSSGYDAFTVNAYGVTPSVPSYSSISSSNFSPKTLDIKARCSASYFTTDAASAVNQSTSYYEYTLELWTVDSGTNTYSATSEMMRNMWLEDNNT